MHTVTYPVFGTVATDCLPINDGHGRRNCVPNHFGGRELDLDGTWNIYSMDVYKQDCEFIVLPLNNVKLNGKCHQFGTWSRYMTRLFQPIRLNLEWQRHCYTAVQNSPDTRRVKETVMTLLSIYRSVATYFALHSSHLFSYAYQEILCGCKAHLRGIGNRNIVQ